MGIDIKEKTLPDCEVCRTMKATRYSFKNKTGEIKPGEQLNADLAFFDGNPVLIVSDAGSGCTLHEVLGSKSDAAESLKTIVNFIETQYDKKVKNIITDNGGEFVNKSMRDWAAKKGIKLDETTSYTPEQNGIAERKNRTLAEMVKCLLADSKLDKTKYWKLALANAVYIRNRSPGKRSGKEMTPYEMLTGQKPNLKHLRRFGETCYAHVPKQKRGKLEENAIQCRIIGFKEKGYLVEEVASGKRYQTVHVSFPKSASVEPDSDSESEPDASRTEKESEEGEETEEQPEEDQEQPEEVEDQAEATSRPTTPTRSQSSRYATPEPNEDG